MAEQLYVEVVDMGIKVFLVMVYNTFNQFIESGLMCEVVVAPGCSYFDINVEDYYYFFYEDDGALQDILRDAIVLLVMLEVLVDVEVLWVDVIVRLCCVVDN